MPTANAPTKPPPPKKPLQDVDVTEPPARRVLRRTETHSQDAVEAITRQIAPLEDGSF